MYAELPITVTEPRLDSETEVTQTKQATTTVIHKRKYEEFNYVNGRRA